VPWLTHSPRQTSWKVNYTGSTQVWPTWRLCDYLRSSRWLRSPLFTVSSFIFIRSSDLCDTQFRQTALPLVCVSTCRSSGPPASWAHSQTHKLPVEPEASSRGCDAEAEGGKPGERTLGESHAEERRWVTDASGDNIRPNRELWEEFMMRQLEKINVLPFADIDEQLLEDRIRKRVFSELRRTTYHWTPLK